MNPPRTRIPFFLILFIGAILFLLFSQFLGTTADDDTLTINQLAQQIQNPNNNIDSIVVDGDLVRVVYNDSSTTGQTIRETKKESDSTLIEQLIAFGVSAEDLSSDNLIYEVESPAQWLLITATLLTNVLPILFLVGVFWFVFRQAQGSNNQAMSFGKSKARMFTGDHPTVTFDDIAGVDEAKEGLGEIIEFLKEPEKFISLGARIPKGVLLVGAPGTGKTLLAKAVSGEAGVPFFSISGSEFVEMFVGVGASRVRDLFEQAKKHSPCIVFVDEIDAVGRQRGAGLGGSHDEREQTLNQMLVEMDGFDTDTNVIIVAATNRPDILDPALLRPGRFDRRVVLDRPDVKGRKEILEVHAKGKPFAKKVSLDVIARGTPGFVGADLENLINEAAILSARRNKKAIGQDELQEAIERIIAGPERRSRLISEEEKMIVAYHEAGHAIISHVLPNADPVHKITIVPRGMAGGYMIALPEDDRTMTSQNKLEAQMAVFLGGRAAEELMFDDVTSGASNDLQRVTEIARSMVTQLGMSKKLGTRIYGKKEEMIFLGREISEQRDYSDATAEEIDQEVLSLVEKAYKIAFDTLKKHKDKLDAIAQKLIVVETLGKKDFEKLFPPVGEKRIGGTPVLLNGNKAN